MLYGHRNEHAGQYIITNEIEHYDAISSVSMRSCDFVSSRPVLHFRHASDNEVVDYMESVLSQKPKARSTLATMSKQRSTLSKQHSTLSKGRNFNSKLVRHCCRFWQQSRTLLRHCCSCGPGFSATSGCVAQC